MQPHHNSTTTVVGKAGLCLRGQPLGSREILRRDRGWGGYKSCETAMAAVRALLTLFHVYTPPACLFGLLFLDSSWLGCCYDDLREAKNRRWGVASRVSKLIKLIPAALEEAIGSIDVQQISSRSNSFSPKQCTLLAVYWALV